MITRFGNKIREAGWKGTLSAAYRYTYSNYFVHIYSRLLSRIYTFKQPSILLLSYPRCGSSWIGNILSFSPDIAYLREPVNQAYQKRYMDWAVIDPFRDRTTLTRYTRLADQAFAGIPPMNVPGVMDNSDDFSLSGRSRKTLMIKEVNPLAGGFYASRYSPKILFLIRHPAAVADSFERMGWLKGQFEEFGYSYASVISRAIEDISKGWSRVILFEDIAANPEKRFDNLFDSLDVRPPIEFKKVVTQFSDHARDNQDPYSIRRVSQDEVNKWQRNLNSSQIDAVMTGYLRSNLKYYTDSS